VNLAAYVSILVKLHAILNNVKDTPVITVPGSTALTILVAAIVPNRLFAEMAAVKRAKLVLIANKTVLLVRLAGVRVPVIEMAAPTVVPAVHRPALLFVMDLSTVVMAIAQLFTLLAILLHKIFGVPVFKTTVMLAMVPIRPFI